MKRVPSMLHKRRNRIAVVFLLPIAGYIILLSAIWINFSRHSSTYEKLTAAAKANGFYTDGWRAHEPANLIEFEDTTKTFLNWRGEPCGYTGFKNQNDQVVIPPIFRSSSGFYDGLASVTFEDQTRCFITPDGSIAFRTGNDSSMGFVNGRAMLHRLTTNPNGKRDLYYGFIDTEGNLIADIKYQYAESFVGERENEYALIIADGFLTSIHDIFTRNREESVSLYDFFIPSWSPLFIDKDGNTVSISEVRASIKRLEASANAQQNQ